MATDCSPDCAVTCRSGERSAHAGCEPRRIAALPERTARARAASSQGPRSVAAYQFCTRHGLGKSPEFASDCRANNAERRSSGPVSRDATHPEPVMLPFGQGEARRSPVIPRTHLGDAKALRRITNVGAPGLSPQRVAQSDADPSDSAHESATNAPPSYPVPCNSDRRPR